MFWNWTANKRLSSKNLNGFKTAYKSVTEDRGGTTLLADSELLFAVGANETWGFQFNIFFADTLTGDFKCAIVAPTGTTCAWGAIGGNTGTITQLENTGTDNGITTATSRSVGASSSTQLLPLYGTAFVGATAGNVTLYWSMATVDGANTASIRKGAHLFAYRLD
jgi:hypothetical protein